MSCSTPCWRSHRTAEDRTAAPDRAVTVPGPRYAYAGIQRLTVGSVRPLMPDMISRFRVWTLRQ